MLSNRFRILALAIAGMLVLAACGGGDDDASDTTAASGGGGDTAISVTMSDFAFEPDSVVVAAGEEITLDLENVGGVEHNFVIMTESIETEAEFDQSNVYYEQNLQPGDSGTFTFTAPAAGTYQVICSISGHFSAGMVGELVSQ
ncbi:MAG: plastocyanin/azurin family copper-binding protein [Acidimicrobiia bacterium]|nr:plastocyanin/azurin family copper-binding protein [Acidimicrobiia bacterium]